MFVSLCLKMCVENMCSNIVRQYKIFFGIIKAKKGRFCFVKRQIFWYMMIKTAFGFQQINSLREVTDIFWVMQHKWRIQLLFFR